MKLKKEILNDFKNVRYAADQIENQIILRIDYILKAIYKEFGHELDDWEFDKNDHLINLIESEYIYIYELSHYQNDICFMLNNKEEVYFEEDQHFPTRWLYEDFEEELKIGKVIMENNLSQEDSDRSMLEAIKNKLSKEELETLKEVIMKPITKESLLIFNKAQETLSKLEEPIHDRITYILKTIHKNFNSELDDWYWEGDYDYSEYYALNEYDVINSIVVHPSYYEIDKYNNASIILNNEKTETFFAEGFPTRWLYEDFEDELIAGIKRVKDKDEKKKSKMNKLSNKKKEALLKVKAKLDPEELDLLKEVYSKLGVEQ